MHRFYFLFLFYIFISCTNSRLDLCNNKFNKDSCIEAKHFSYSFNDSLYILNVQNPWQGATNINIQYRLSKCKNTDIGEINIPVQKVICMSTTYVAFLNSLKLSEHIHGISGGKYIYNEEIRRKYDNNEIYEVGYDQNINFEKIIQYKPDVIFAYGIESDAYLKRLSDLGINIVYVADYLEETPLGKLEWIKFFGLFFDKLDFAGNYFDSVSNNYNQLKKLIPQNIDRPTVLSAFPWKGSWYLPGSKSYFAKLIYDSGGEYIFKDNGSNESKPMSIETVLLKSLNADYWLNPDVASSLNYIFNSDKKLASIKAYKENKVFNNNKRVILNGGNDYWESGVVQPDIILRDLISIIHPEIIKENDYFYYQKLE